MENTIKMGSTVAAWESNIKPERFEIIVYVNPDFDTILIENTALSYYTAIRMWGRETVDARYTKQYVPLRQRDKYIGRCVGLPGDNILIKDGQLFVNRNLYTNDNIKKLYALKSRGSGISTKFFENLGIDNAEIMRNVNYYHIPVTQMQVADLVKSTEIDTSFYGIREVKYYDKLIFPHSDFFQWNSDQFGEVQIPKKGLEITLTLQNLPLYSRLIENFEGNKLQVINNKIHINNKPADKYIPRKDYYFIVNDNRDSSFDSRYWGFLPEDYITGKVLRIFR